MIIERLLIKDRHRGPPSWSLDPITEEVIELVNERFPDHFGDLDDCFMWPVTREQALVMLDHFINERLASFGDFQDAMVRGKTLCFIA